MSLSLRPLLPDIIKRDRGPPIGSESPPKRQQGPHGQACEACRTFKTKCTRERPTCAKCLQRQTPCRYVETVSRRARQKYYDLRQNRSSHEELIRLMATLPEEDAVVLFRRIREGAESGAVLNQFRTGDLLLQMHVVPECRFEYTLPYSSDIPMRLLTSRSPYINSKILEAASHRNLLSMANELAGAESELRILPDINSMTYQSQYTTPFHAAILIEPRLEAAKPSEWTTVCKDDALLRKLLAAFFTHEYHLCPAFHKDYFLEDMAAEPGNRDKLLHCSPLLVNAVLAYACCCHEKILNRFKYWCPENLGYRFFAEAKRIWEMQALTGENRNLASIQAVMVMNIHLNLSGLDKLGDSYGLKGVAIAKEINLFDGNAHIADARLRHARNFTAWCVYNTNVHLSLLFFRPHLMDGPPSFPLPDPLSNPNWYGEIWTRYPLSPTLTQMHLAHYLKAKFNYVMILGDLVQASFKHGSTLSAQQAMVFATRLIKWFKSLPMELSPQNIFLPAHFLLHLDYLIYLWTVCHPFINEQWSNGLSPHEVVSHVEQDINILLRLYYIRHSFTSADSWLTAPLSKIGFMALQRLNDQTHPGDVEYLRSTLSLALNGLREQGRNYYLSRTVYYIVRNQVRPEESGLLAGMEDRESADDESPELCGEVHSSWVARSVDISVDAATEELSYLAKQYLKLEIEE